MCSVSSKVQQNICMRALRFVVIGCVYWCASERMHAAEYFCRGWDCLGVLTEENRTFISMLCISPAREKQNETLNVSTQPS